MTATLKKPTTLVLALLILCLGSFSTSALADDTIPGDPPGAPQKAGLTAGMDLESQPRYLFTATHKIYLPSVQKPRLGLTVQPQNRQESLDFYLQQYLTSEGEAINWTGNQGSCTPGTTSSGFREAVLRRINYFRAMAGVPGGIIFSEESNRKAQAAALMMSVNKQLSHTPPTTWLCYSQDGSDGAGASDLYLGRYGWNAISGYIKDPGSGNYFAGHRRWILYPQTQVMGTGDIPDTSGYPSANALLIFDSHIWEQRPQTREEYVAWPPPGYVPYQVVFPRWSFSYAGADFSGATVSMNFGGSPVSVSQVNTANGYGENTLVWIPMGLNDGASWPTPAADTTYTVNIQNIIINSTSRNFTYYVTVFNPTP